MWYCSRIFPAYFCARVIMIFSKLFVWVQPTYKKNASHDVLLEDFHKTNPSVYPHPRPTQNSVQHLSSLFSNRPPEVLTSKTCFFADTFTWNHKIASFFSVLCLFPFKFIVTRLSRVTTHTKNSLIPPEFTSAHLLILTCGCLCSFQPWTFMGHASWERVSEALLCSRNPGAWRFSLLRVNEMMISPFATRLATWRKFIFS